MRRQTAASELAVFDPRAAFGANHLRLGSLFGVRHGVSKKCRTPPNLALAAGKRVFVVGTVLVRKTGPLAAPELQLALPKFAASTSGGSRGRDECELQRMYIRLSQLTSPNFGTNRAILNDMSFNRCDGFWTDDEPQAESSGCAQCKSLEERLTVATEMLRIQAAKIKKLEKKTRGRSVWQADSATS